MLELFNPAPFGRAGRGGAKLATVMQQQKNLGPPPSAASLQVQCMVAAHAPMMRSCSSQAKASPSMHSALTVWAAEMLLEPTQLPCSPA